MKRRNFIKTTVAGSAFIMTSGAFAFENSVSRKNYKYGFQSERRIPVGYNVDVAIVGGTSAAVAAATEAAKHGASVFLAAPQPYLGEDICGTYRLWAENEKATGTELGKKIFGAGLPTPMHVKKTLDNELIENKVNFLYSSYVTEIVHDSKGHPAGVIIVNRSGRQAVKAKVIIDATARGLVARLAGVDFSDYPAGKQEFKYIVVGNQPKSIADGKMRKLPQPVVFKDKSYDALEYTLLLEIPNNSWDSFCRAEHEARDLTWDPGQVDAGDLLFYVPPDFITGKERWNQPTTDEERMNIGSFLPKNTERLFVLSGVADVHRKAASELLQPGALIHMGERIGRTAAKMAGEIVPAEDFFVKGFDKGQHVPGDVGEILEGLRPTFNLGEIPSEKTALPVLGSFDVVVLGGGTAGAPAGVGASRHGAKTLVLEYLHGLGGIGTMGMIGRYWDGYRDGYTQEVDWGVRVTGGDHPRQKQRLDEWVFDWKTEYFRREIRDSGGEVWFGVLGIGAYVHEGTVKGVVVATPAGKGIVLGHTVIDSTGSADIAIAAGAAYEYTDGLSVAVQGAGIPFKNPEDHYNNTDWTFTDDTDVLDVWRTFIVAKDKFENQYDLGKLPQTRERRRMIGDYTISVLDIYNKRTYPDTFSIHQSSFDTHGYTIDPFFSLRWPDERTKHITALVPFRALLPKNIEGIAVTGLGASAHRDAMPVIRMQPCLQNQGFSVGWAAALAAGNNQMIRHIDLKWLQKQLVEIKNLPEGADNYMDNYPPTMKQIQEAAQKVVNDLEGLEILLWDKERSIPVMEDFFHLSQNKEHRLVYARILGMLGNPTGWKELIDAIDAYKEWDEGWNFRGMHQYGRSLSYLDSLIIAAGRTKKVEVLPTIIRLADELTPESHFSHFRAVAIAFETIANAKAAEPLFKLLQMEGMRGHSMPDIQTAKRLTPPDKNDVSTRNNSLRELTLGRALYKCGDLNGVGNQILNEYSKDLRGHYYRHASGVLQIFSRAKGSKVEM
jgi:flavin-dependent dehydrogenase